MDRIAGSYGTRCALNLTLTLGVEFGLQVMLRGRIPAVPAVAVTSGAVMLCYVAGVRRIERRPVSELTGEGGGWEFASGLGLGMLLFGAVMLVLWTLGVYRFTGWGQASALAAGFPFSFLVAAAEEAIFRGLLFRLISKLLGTWGALAITSVLFGAGQAFNPDATLRSAAATGLESGVLLGLAYALTGRLWLPIGTHTAWDFAEASIFGMAASGEVTPGSLSFGALNGPKILTGGALGPEGSVVAVAVCLAASIFLLVRLLRSGNLERPIWRTE
jgi:CAAX protease family protein